MIKVSYSFYHIEQKEWIEYTNNSLLAFYGIGGFGVPLNPGMYNSSMHLRTYDDLDLCKKPHLVNLKYVDDETVKVAETFTCKLTEIQKQHLIRVRFISKIALSLKSISLFIFENDTKPINPEENGYEVRYFIYGDEKWRKFDKDNLIDERKVMNDKLSKIHTFYIGLSVKINYDKLEKKNQIRFNLGINFKIKRLAKEPAL